MQTSTYQAEVKKGADTNNFGSAPLYFILLNSIFPLSFLLTAGRNRFLNQSVNITVSNQPDLAALYLVPFTPPLHQAA